MTTIPIERICAIAALSIIAVIGIIVLRSENLALNCVVAIAAFISSAVIGQKKQ